MKLFAEIIEISKKENEISEFLKIEVQNKQQAIDKINQAISKSPWLNIKFQKRIHYCNHSEQGESNKPCFVEYV